MKPRLVIGFGQPEGDDAVGLFVAEELSKLGIETCSVTDGAALTLLLSETDAALIIDAVVINNKTPGVVFHWGSDEVTAILASEHAAASRWPVSSHGISIFNAIKIARALGSATFVEIVGITIAPPLSLLCSSASPIQQKDSGRQPLSEPVFQSVKEAVRVVSNIQRQYHA